MTDQEKLYTVEELAELPDNGKRHELVRGVLVEMSRPKSLHGEIQALLTHFLVAHVLGKGLGRITTEAGYILFRDPDTIYGPDVAFLSKERLANPDMGEYIPMAPDLAVEIVSPNDTASEVLIKVLDYLKAGTKLVWIVYPIEQMVFVYQPEKTGRLVGINDMLHGGEVLPDFVLNLRDLFAVSE